MVLCPVRCYSCNKVVANKWEPYKTMIENGSEPREALEKLGLKRYCCKRMIISHVEHIDKLLKYSEYNHDSK